MWRPFCSRSGCCRWCAPKWDHLAILSIFFSVWDLYTSWRWMPVDLNAFLLLMPTEIYKDVILQIKAFNNDNKPSCKTAFASLELQLRPCPAPPLMAPRWLADRSLQDGASCSRTHGAHIWGMWKPRLTWQPGRTLHHLTKMKSVTSWPVFQLPIRTPLPRPVFLALRWRAAGVKTPSATDLLRVNEPCSICEWRTLILVRTL